MNGALHTNLHEEVQARVIIASFIASLYTYYTCFVTAAMCILMNPSWEYISSSLQTDLILLLIQCLEISHAFIFFSILP